ncbi:MAG: efflux RND transporter periplasmic adaptor subunit [Deltaproteobacteria bacterium]|nr:efflux RND transporter periplasmic adaptor subunit [Deltaproteobacteria bacterium]
MLPIEGRIAVLLITVGFLGILGCGRDSHKTGPPAPEVTVTKPVEQEVTRYLEYTGTTAALEFVDVRARVQGWLESIKFVPRSKVKKDELLFVIDPRPFQARVEQAKAVRDANKASLDLAQYELEKAQYLEAKEALSQLKLKEATAKRDAAAAEVEKAKADLDLAKLNLDYCQVRSPINGRVSRNLVDVGNLVGAEQKTLLTTVVNDDPMYAYFNLSELDVLPLIREFVKDKTAKSVQDELNPVYMGLADEKGYPHEGHIDFADTQIDSSTGTMQVRGVFPNLDGVLMPGMFVRLRVPVEKRRGLLVPEVAIQADQAGRYVLVVNSQDVVEKRRVKPGQTVDRMRVIDEGLSVDDRVVVSGVQRARPGIKVKPTVTQAPTVAGAPTQPQPAAK